MASGVGRFRGVQGGSDRAVTHQCCGSILTWTSAVEWAQLPSSPVLSPLSLSIYHSLSSQIQFSQCPLITLSFSTLHPSDLYHFFSFFHPFCHSPSMTPSFLILPLSLSPSPFSLYPSPSISLLHLSLSLTTPFVFTTHPYISLSPFSSSPLHSLFSVQDVFALTLSFSPISWCI